MTPARKLSLKREALHELSNDELAGIAAGAAGSDTCGSCLTWYSCYLTDCLGHDSRRICFVSMATECVAETLGC